MCSNGTEMLYQLSSNIRAQIWQAIYKLESTAETKTNNNYIFSNFNTDGSLDIILSQFHPAPILKPTFLILI